MTTAIRYILSFVLIIGAYRETGIFTATCFLLILIRVELEDWLNSIK